MKKATFLSALLVGTALVAAAPASAEPVDHFHHIIAHPHPGFHPRPAYRHFVLRHDFHHFSPAEHRWWVGGRWRHTWWHGRYGWWWNVGGFWYFYDTPVYPYPGYVSETYYDDPAYYDDQDGGSDNQGAPGDQSGGDQGGYDQSGGYGGVWYHCSAPEGYYPYVKNCRNWEQVPAQPNDMGPGPGGGPNDGPPPGYGGDQGPPPPPGH